MTTKTKTVSDEDKVTIGLTVSIPKHYLDYYNALTKLGDVGSLEFIAMGGIVGYLNALHDEIQIDGISALYPAYPEIKKSLTIT